MERSPSSRPAPPGRTPLRYLPVMSPISAEIYLLKVSQLTSNGLGKSPMENFNEFLIWPMTPIQEQKPPKREENWFELLKKKFDPYLDRFDRGETGYDWIVWMRAAPQTYLDLPNSGSGGVMGISEIDTNRQYRFLVEILH